MIPKPEPRPELISPQAAHQSRMMWAGGGLLAAITFGAGAFFYSTHGGNTAPAPAPAVSQSQNTSVASTTDMAAAAQLSMLPSSQAAKALARTSFNADQKARILAAVQRGEMRLVQMPVLDASGAAGQIIDVTTSGLTQRVVLTGKFQPLLLPIAVAGQVMVSPVTMPHAPALTIGAMTALGPEILPSLTALDQRIVLSVIVQ